VLREISIVLISTTIYLNIMANCSACGKTLSATGVARCTECVGVYHKVCVNMLQTARVSASWACPACKAKAPRKDNSETPVKNSDLGDTGSGAPSSPNHQDDVSVQLRLLRAEFGAVLEEVVGLRRDVAELHQLVGGFQARFELVEERVKCLEERMEERPAEAAQSDLVATVAALKLELCDRDQDLLLNDLEITGVPEYVNENPTHLMSLVASKLGVELDARDIVFAERVGARRAPTTVAAGTTSASAVPVGANAPVAVGVGGRPRPLVVRLARRGPRAELLRAARVRRGADTSDFGLPCSPCKIYINERLTRVNRMLFYRAREECKRLNWRFCWTKDGRVYARRLKDSAALRIRTELDLVQVFTKAAI
jgi:hypothetical protein